MSWIYLILAGLSEIVWAFGLKESHGFTVMHWSLVTLFFLWLSFFLLAKAIKHISIGTAYAVFTGIGAVGTVIAGIVLLNDDVHWLKMISLLALISGIAGLKFVDDRSSKNKERS